MTREAIKKTVNRSRDGEEDKKTLSFAANAANNLFDRRVAVEHGKQAAVEDRAHPAFDRGALDRGVVGALEDQAIDRPRRHQQLGDRPAPAKAGAAAVRTTH